MKPDLNDMRNGPEIDTAMVEAGIVGNRMPYQTDKHCRNAINNGQIRYLDTHISTFNQMARFGFLPDHRDVDVAIIEACSIKDLGKGKIGISIALIWLKPYFVPHYIAVIIFSNLNLSSCGMFLAEIFRPYSGFDFLPLYEW